MHYYYSITSKIFPSNFVFTHFLQYYLLHGCAEYGYGLIIALLDFSVLTKITFDYQKIQLKQLYITLVSSNAIFEYEHLILQHLYFNLIFSALARRLQNMVMMHRFNILLQYKHETPNQSTSRRRVLYWVECLYCNNVLNLCIITIL